VFGKRTKFDNGEKFRVRANGFTVEDEFQTIVTFTTATWPTIGLSESDLFRIDGNG
jgi:hypothetical protein